MTETQKKALALVNEVRASHGLTPYENLYATPAAIEALCRAIEQHEAFRQEVSDAVDWYFDAGTRKMEWFKERFARFIIAKPDPLVEALAEYRRTPGSGEYVTPEKRAEVLRAALAARGLKIVEDK